MKTKVSLLLAVAAALGIPGAIAQEQSPAEQTQPPQAAPFTSPAPATPQPSIPPPPATPPQATPPQPPPPPSAEKRDKDEERPRRERPDRRERNRDRDRDRAHDRHHDKHHGPEGRHEERKSEPRPFLGVMTSPVPPALSAQLGLPEGFGLLVQEVLPDSPAAAAGIQKHDVLKMFNDQQVVTPDQLAALVRAAGKDASVALTLIRKGEEQKVDAKLAERAFPERRRRMMDRPFGHAPRLDPRGGPEEIQQFHDRVRKFQERARERRMERQDRPQAPERDDSAQVPSADILRAARPGRGRQISVTSSSGVTTVDGSKARLFLKDDDGEIEVSAENGKRTLTAKNAKGEVVFSGPVNTEEERRAVPEQFRSKLDTINIRQRIDAETGASEAFAGTSSEPEAFAEGDIQ